MKALNMQRDWEVFAKDGATGVGAVREIFADHIVVYFEGFGEQRIVENQIASVHDGKVLLNVGALPNDVQQRLPKRMKLRIRSFDRVRLCLETDGG